MQQALIYARVSSQEQTKGWSPVTQLEACRAYAVELGITVVAEYYDTETGATVDRPHFQAMMCAIRDGQAGVVIVHQTDRLHRDLAHAMLTRRELQHLGVELHTVKRGRSGTSPEEQFADNIDDLLAELERARIIERTNRGKRRKLQEGLVLGAGPAPYGYHYIGQGRERHLVIDEATAPIVRQIFQWYAAGEGVGPIAERLTQLGTPTPSDRAGRERWHTLRPAGEWHRNYIYPILNQTAYSGEYALYRRRRTGKTTYALRDSAEQFHVSVPSLVSPEIWAAVQQRLAEGKRRSSGHRIHEYLLGGRIACACGYRVHGRASSKSGRHAEKRLWYLCNGRVARLTATPCGIALLWLRAEMVDRVVWTWIAALLCDPVLLEHRIVWRLEQSQATQADIHADRARLLARRAKIARAQQRILDLYESEEIDRQEWRRRKAAHEAELADLDQQLAALDAPPPIVLPSLPEHIPSMIRLLANDVRPRLPLLSFAERRAIVEALGIQVTLGVEGPRSARVAWALGHDVLLLP